MQSYEKFWMNVTSESIQVAEAVNHMEELYGGCGLEYSCFGMPADCEKNKSCEILFAWAKIKSEPGQLHSLIRMKLAGNVKVLEKADGEFIAVRISRDAIKVKLTMHSDAY